MFPAIWDKAAALMESLGHSYALVDGNKRLTWNATWWLPRRERSPAGRAARRGSRVQFMYDLVRGRLTGRAVADRLQKFAA